MASGERSGDWQDYYERTAGRPARPTLLAALDRFAATPAGALAIDLGCGDGRDTVELLRRGWRVLAIDAEEAAISRLRARPDLPEHAALRTMVARFEDVEWPIAALINASFALPLCPPARFFEVWARIGQRLAPGGRFSGQLFGDRDSWAGRPGVTCLGRAAVERLLDGFAREMFEEEETDAVTPPGKRKHWHLFHLVARKP